MQSFSLGERYVLPNVHGLLHLPEDVRDLGPLWSHSCFPFESGNGELLRLFHGSQSVNKQVCIHTYVCLCTTKRIYHDNSYCKVIDGVKNL